MGKCTRIIAVVVLAAGLAGCNEPKKVSATEFQFLLARNPESMRHAEFAGVKNGKAYLKVSSMSTLSREKWTAEYFVTDVNQLPKEWLEQQKAGEEN